MKTLGIFLGSFLLFFMTFCWIVETAEEAYFEGQRDALNKDVRIKKNSDSIYVWTKSPWDSGRKPSFEPTSIDSNIK